MGIESLPNGMSYYKISEEILALNNSILEFLDGFAPGYVALVIVIAVGVLIASILLSLSKPTGGRA